MVAVRAAAIAFVRILNVTVLAPAGIVAVAGTSRASSWLTSRHVTPAAGAGLRSVTVPVVSVPLIRSSCRVSSRAGAGWSRPLSPSSDAFTTSVALRLTPPELARIVTVVSLATADVSMMNAALDAPGGTVIVEGTDAAGELLDSETMVPPAGAAALNVAVPSEVSPPLISGVETLSEDRVTTVVGPGTVGAAELHARLAAARMTRQSSRRKTIREVMHSYTPLECF